MAPAQRLPGIDALKGLACVLIVWHHLAFYGPMSDVVHSAAPWLINWLYDYGRMAVQVFFVVSGFLAAAALEPAATAALSGQAWRLVLRRYRRLAVPLMAAVGVAVVVAAAVRPWLPHPSVPGPPEMLQILSHLFFLQDVMGQEALSAGIWYVAIDFQLFVISVALFTLVPGRWRIAVVLSLAAASLWLFNRHAALDMSGLYFFGSYALGILAWWASRSRRPTRWLLLIAGLGALGLAMDFRGRLVVAMAVAMGLVWAQRSPGPTCWLQQHWLLRLGQVSYSVFLIHFPVCLLVNAAVTHFWPAQLAANVIGMLLAFALSLLAGDAFYRCIESRSARWQRVWKSP